MEDDRILVKDILEGRRGAMERFVRAHQETCWRVLYRLTGDREDARDLCQEAFLRAHRALPWFRFDASLKTWTTRIAWSVGLRHLEKRRIPLDAFTDVDDAADQADDAEDIASALVREERRAQVRAALSTLAPVQRTLLGMYHFEDMTLPDISRVTGMPVGTIKSHLFRGRLALRQQLIRHPECTP